MDGWKRWLKDVIRSTSAKTSKCPDAPCRCSEPGCAFAGEPAWFIYHVKAAHSWPVNVVGYGKACQLQLPASKPRCVLVAKEDMRVFVLSVAAPRGGVSLVCLRANAAARPHYTCKVWATTGSAAAAAGNGKVPTVWVEMEVPSSTVAGEAEAADEAEATEAEDEEDATEAEEETAPLVPRKMLHEPSKELHLIVRIDKLQR